MGHQALGRIELMVNKLKKMLKKSGVLNLFKTANFTKSEMGTILASVTTTLNTRPLAIYKGEIFSPQGFHYHNFTMNPNTDSIMPIIKNTESSIEDQINDALSEFQIDKMNEFKTFKEKLGVLASNLDFMYKVLATNLLPTLLKAHDDSGNSLNKFQHCGEDLQLWDVVFDQKTFEKTKNVRSSLFSVVYISKDKKSLLIGRPKPQILRKLTYITNTTVSKPENYYKKGNLHLEYVSRDVRSLNFICRGDKTELVVFDTEWMPLQMESYLEKIMEDQSYCIHIKAPVITRRDNIDIKDTINLLERQLIEKTMKPEVEIVIPKQKYFSDIEEKPVQTRSGRQIKRPERYGNKKSNKTRSDKIIFVDPISQAPSNQTLILLQIFTLPPIYFSWESEYIFALPPTYFSWESG